MDMDRLSEFALIAESRSVSDAARALGLSTATLSARLRSFEKDLGASLFLRGGRELRLTDVGRCLLANTEDILSRYRRITGGLQAQREHQYTRLRIAIADPGIPLHLGPLMDRINLSSPDMELSLLDASRVDPVAALLDGSVDILFATCVDQPVPQGVARRTVSGPQQFVILPADHPLSGRSGVSLRDLSGECFLLYNENDSAFARWFQLRNLESSGIDYTTLETGSGSLFLHFLVPVGKGILITPYHLVDLPNSVELPLLDAPHPAYPFLFCAVSPRNGDTAWFLRDYFAFAESSVGHQSWWDEEVLK